MSSETTLNEHHLALHKHVGGGKLFRRLLISIVLMVTALVVIAPLVVILTQAFSSGFSVYVQSVASHDTLHAIILTALVAVVVVPINILFGIGAAWLITKFEFPGRRVLSGLIELPYSISPIVAGVAYLFVYGAQGLLGPLLAEHGIKIVFALPAIFLVSLFVTAPFVARSLISLMQTQGTTEEEAALMLGASGFATFMRVTLPNIRWALLYGAILCNARVMGEFGSVSIVSGNIRGVTNTLPLQIELLSQDYNMAGAFVAASVLMLIALITIIARTIFEKFEDITKFEFN